MPAGFWHFWEKYGRFGVLGAGVGLILLGAVLFWTNRQQKPEVEFLDSSQVMEESEIVVDLSGQLVNPGVYHLQSGSRVMDAVDLAGGFSKQIDQNWVDKNLNLARKLTDGEKIYFPKIGEITQTEALAVGSVKGTTSSGLVNINSANQSQLETLTGIGPSFANRIIEYRQSNGGFKSIEEIMAVSGIGTKTFEKIKDQITI
ncbi:MAG: helix-hairpin-helix domain-containing protein [Patescibacteria group bacterium]